MPLCTKDGYPMVPVRDGIAKTVEYFRANPPEEK